MAVVEFFENLTLVDVFLIGTAAMFFSSLGVLAGVMDRKFIGWSALVGLGLLAYVYRYELEYFWLVITNPR